MLPRRRNGAGTLLLFLARRLAIFLFVGVNHLQSLYRQVNRHFHLNPRFRFGSEEDSLAERGEFELPVPISEQPDDNVMGSGAQTKCRDRPRLKRLVGLCGRQPSKETFPSCAMNDIAADVAAAIQIKGKAILPRSLPATLKSTRNAPQRDSVLLFVSMSQT